VAHQLEAGYVHDDSVAGDWVIIVRLWWEHTDVNDVAMRARVTSTANGSVVGKPGAAATVEGILAAVRLSTERFLEHPPPTGIAHG
jgi:hypothetical protein